MSNIYEYNYGTQFGFWGAGDTRFYHSFRGRTSSDDKHPWMLYPVSKPVIEPPEPQVLTVDIPGTDAVIDYTTALTGDIHYNSRKGTFPFKYTGERRNWDRIYHEILSALHGKKMGIVLDEDPGWYWYGRLNVEDPEYKNNCQYITITADLYPYQYCKDVPGDKWKWDPFSFVDGVIRDPDNYYFIEVAPNEVRKVTIIGSDMPLVPDVYLEWGTVWMTYPATVGDTLVSKRIKLESGNNAANTPDFWIKKQKYDLYFQGDGVVDIRYRVGRL
jgi:hypothetical protein